MLIYIRVPSHAGKTFVLSVKDRETVTLVKAKIMHTMYSNGVMLGRFRLSYEGELMDDQNKLRDYGIRSTSGRTHCIDAIIGDPRVFTDPSINKALADESNILMRREKLCSALRWTAFILLLTVVPLSFSNVWFFLFFSVVAAPFGYYVTPRYKKGVGLLGNATFNAQALQAYAVLLAVMAVAHVVAIFFMIRTVIAGTGDVDGREAYLYYSIAVSFLVLMFLVAVLALVSSTLNNFMFVIGDILDSHAPMVDDRGVLTRLVQAARDTDADMQRGAAMELSAIASSDSSQQRDLVRCGALSVLGTLALSDDPMTLVFASEALVALAADQKIARRFHSEGLLPPLYALLRSEDSRYNAVATLLLLSNVEADDLHEELGWGNSECVSSLAAVGVHASENPGLRELVVATMVNLTDSAPGLRSVASKGLAAMVACTVDPRATESTLRYTSLFFEQLTAQRPDTLVYAAQGMDALKAMVACPDGGVHLNGVRIVQMISRTGECAELTSSSPLFRHVLGLLSSEDVATATAMADVVARISMTDQVNTLLIQHKTCVAFEKFMERGDVPAETCAMFQGTLEKLKMQTKLQRFS